jgi:SAM-dependent methyltransferase
MNDDLDQIYEIRFSGLEEYRNNVWEILVNQFFSKWINPNDTILDLGCGYGEFINHANAKVKHAMDLNPRTRKLLKDDVIFHEQDCSKAWPLEENSLDLIFTSNFFEHLPNKKALDATISEAKKCLKKGGRIIAMGPNISVLKGKYWDFWDHHVALSDQSLGELLQIHDFTIEKSYSKFLPYNMVRVKEHPLFMVSLYLRFPFLWKLFGKQFLIVAQKD